MIKVLHILYQSFPDYAGSSIRSKDVIASQVKAGIEPIVITSPFQRGVQTSHGYELIDGVKYYRTYANKPKEQIIEDEKSIGLRAKKMTRILAFAKKVLEIAKQEEVSLIHAHATFFCGISAFYASKRLKIPYIYEVRSLWEERQIKSTTTLSERMFRDLIKFFETTSMKKAKHIIVINENLKKDILSRNIEAEKITVIANAVNFDKIKINDSPTFQQKSAEDLVFGYIGSFSHIEGISVLLDSVASLKKKNVCNKVLLFGGIGPYLKEIKKKINELSLSDIEVKGALPPDEIYKAYKEIDIIVNPRIKSRITDSVTPLKPLEAMAYKKLVIASNVGGMVELIKDHQTGLLFNAGSVESLEKKIEYCLDAQNKSSIIKIINSGYKYVKEQKSWEVNGEEYRNLYTKLLYE